MKIVHCIPNFAGGGAERQLAYLAKSLVEAGIEVHIVYLSEGKNYNRICNSGATLHRLNFTGNHDPLLLYRLWKILREIKPDIIQSWLRQMDVLCGILSSISNVPWILSERNSEMAYEGSKKDLFRKILARNATHIVSNSKTGDKYWARNETKRVGRSVVGNGLPLDEIDGVIPNSVRQSGKKIIFAGRLVEQRNINNLLLSAKMICQMDPGVIFEIFGTGPLEGQMRKYLSGNDLSEKIRLTGYVDEKELWSQMKSATTLVSLSLYEGQPNAVMEAMACGCPLVCSDIPEHREFLDEKTAVLVNPYDLNSITEGIKSSLEQNGLAAKRAAEALLVSKKWSMQATSKKYITLYEELLQQKLLSVR